MTSSRAPDGLGSGPVAGEHADARDRSSVHADAVSDAAGGVDTGFDDPAVAAVAAGLVGAIDDLVVCEAWRCSPGDLERLVQTVEVAQRRLDLVVAGVAVQAFDRGLPSAAGFTTSASGSEAKARVIAGWLRSLTTISPYQAGQRAKAAVALFADPALSPQLAATRAAALSGQISTGHAVVIADTLTTLSPPLTPQSVVDAATRTDVERILVDRAAVLDPVQTRVLAKRTVAVLDPHAGDRLAKDEDARAARRGLSFTADGSGLVYLRGTLTPQCAGMLATAIDAASAPRPAADGTADSRTPAMRRHDGLQHVLGQVVAADGLLPSTHGSPYRLVVTVPHATLTAALTHRGSQPNTALWSGRSSDQAAATRPGSRAPAEPSAPVLPGLLPDGYPLSPLTVQTLACSADLVPVLVDDDHQPLDVGDTQYAFPPKIRTAIITRDRGCTYPGCGAPAPWCDVHHLTPFAAGGPTSVTNGALLCGRHHRYVHALNLTGRVTTANGTSHVQWHHRPTSWTATTATTAASGRHPALGRHSPDANQQPVLTDRCLDQLIKRWQRRRAAPPPQAA
jgi:hypothetical protein